MATKKPAMLVANDTWTRAWRLTAAGRPLDLTGASARLHLRDAAGVKVAEASTADGRLTLDGPAGRLDLTMPAAVMALPPGAYRFALEITDAEGQVRTVETHTLILLADVTHDDEAGDGGSDGS